MLDFDTDDDDEPRTVVIRGFGPRWAEAPALPGVGPVPASSPARRQPGPLPDTAPQTPERNS